jgi:hypothetical protein
MDNIEIKKMIKALVTTDELWYANYYMSSMKKAPHGGVFNVNIPNYYIHHMPKNIFNIFRNTEGNNVLEFFSQIFKDAIIELEKYDFNINDIANLVFGNADNWYMTLKLLKPMKQYEELNKSMPLIWKVISENLKIEDYFILDEEIVEYGFICWIINNNFIRITGLPEIKKFENLFYEHNKYGLSRLENVEYRRQGFIYYGKYYLYNIFFDTSILEAFDNIPATIKVIFDEIENVDFKMRIDENLAIEESKFISTASTDSQVFRGIKFDISNIEKLVYTKEIIVHFNLETLDKLVMIIKSDREGDEQFYHIEIEELWNYDKTRDDVVITNFIHSKYYPKRKIFNHIDFSVNQYSHETYKLKYNDNQNVTGIPIDKYCDTHYKVWCAEANEISIETWSKLVEITLDKPFRELFFEIIEQSKIK